MLKPLVFALALVVQARVGRFYQVRSSAWLASLLASVAPEAATP